MTIVVDACVAVKWFLKEHNSALADRILDENIENIVVPAIFGIEVAATLVREANIAKPHANVMRDAIARLTDLLSDGAIRTHPTRPKHIATAANIAIDIGHPIKDCIYLVLAMELDCELVTADARFAAKAKEVWGKVRVLGA